MQVRLTLIWEDSASIIYLNNFEMVAYLYGSDLEIPVMILKLNKWEWVELEDQGTPPIELHFVPKWILKKKKKP